jgi:hypothetical protein
MIIIPVHVLPVEIIAVVVSSPVRIPIGSAIIIASAWMPHGNNTRACLDNE